MTILAPSVPSKGNTIGNLFLIVSICFPLATISLPLLGSPKSIYAIVQAAAILIAVFYLTHTGRIKFYKDNLPLVGCLLLLSFFLMTSTIVSGEGASMSALFQFTKFTVFALVMGLFLSNTSLLNLDKLLFYFSMSICVLAISCITDLLNITQFYRFSYTTDVRSVGLLGPPNRSGLLLAFAIGYNINLVIRQPVFLSPRNLVVLLLTLVAMGTLLVSASRSGLALTALFTAILFFNSRRQVNLKSTFRLALVMIASALVVLAVIPDRVLQYVQLRAVSSIEFISNPTSSESQGASITNRLHALSDAAYLARQNPFFGVGPDNIKKTRYETFDSNLPHFLTTKKVNYVTAHNTYVNTFAECGVAAGISLILLVLVILRTLYWRWKVNDDFAHCALFSFYFIYMVFYLFTQSELWRNNLLFTLFFPIAMMGTVAAVSFVPKSAQESQESDVHPAASI